MLVDDVTIKIAAGNGGKGAVAFEKNKFAIGPTGARGGDGGSVYFEAISDLSALNKFRNKKDWRALSGQDGRSQYRDGKVAPDLILLVPTGTVIHNLDTRHSEELVHKGDRILIAKGGRGGKGNFFFRSPINTSPEQFEYGQPGDKFALRLELKLIADIGLIGLPNAGKSSLINEVTKAQAKVASYPFTTLEPNLGTYGTLILADIPGLIEGASAGKGLGTRFLRHIERTNTLFHLISAESKTPIKDYKTIRKELGAHNPELLEKVEYVFISKSDVTDAKTLKKNIAALKKHNSKVLPISIHDWESLEKVKKILDTVLKKKD